MGFLWRRKKPPEAKEDTSEIFPPHPPETLPSFKVEKTLRVEDVSRAKTSVRISSVEREILAEALTRIYEATAEGKITPEERDKLSSKYREQITKLDSAINHDQQMINLHELEETRNELLKMFQDKFGELNVKIEHIRRDLGVTPREIPRVKPPTLLLPEREKPSVEEIPERAPPAVAAPPVKRRRADEELKKLTEDLRQELEKLEQMELEG